MPEGHTLHRLALDGQLVTSVEAWGKHLFYRFERGEILDVHLGLFGRFRRRASSSSLMKHAALLARLGPDLLRKDASHRLRSGGPVCARYFDQPCERWVLNSCFGQPSHGYFRVTLPITSFH